MRILFAYRYGVVGGVCTQLYNRMRGLAARGDVEVVFFFGGDYGAAELLRPFGEVHVGDVEAFRALVTREAFDVIDVIDTPELIAVASELAPDRLVVEVHTTYTTSLAYLANREFTCRRFLVPSAYSRSLLVDRFQIPEAQVGIVANCLDAEAFSPVDVEPPARPIVSWVGKLDAHKGWEDFIDIAALLASVTDDVELWMFGGETAPDKVKDRLFESMGAFELGARLRWFPRVDYRAMNRVHSTVAASGGLNVVTSRDESFGMSVAEALLCGCPVVAPAVGALGELHTGPGLSLYPAGELVAAQEKIRALLTSTHDARADLARCRRAMVERWSTDTVAATLLNELGAAHD